MISVPLNPIAVELKRFESLKHTRIDCGSPSSV